MYSTVRFIKPYRGPVYKCTGSRCGLWNGRYINAIQWLFCLASPKTLPISAFVYWISVKFYETDCNLHPMSFYKFGFISFKYLLNTSLLCGGKINNSSQCFFYSGDGVGKDEKTAEFPGLLLQRGVGNYYCPGQN